LSDSSPLARLPPKRVAITKSRKGDDRVELVDIDDGMIAVIHPRGSGRLVRLGALGVLWAIVEVGLLGAGAGWTAPAACALLAAAAAVAIWARGAPLRIRATSKGFAVFRWSEAWPISTGAPDALTIEATAKPRPDAQVIRICVADRRRPISVSPATQHDGMRLSALTNQMRARR
jgi:hypothetical protein